MKFFLFLSLLISASAFQASLTNNKRLGSSLFFYPDNYDRAVECATHVDYCDLEELERLANELQDFQASETGGQIQGKEHYRDTQQVQQILVMQSKLKELTNDYITDHHKPETADLSDIF